MADTPPPARSAGTGVRPAGARSLRSPAPAARNNRSGSPGHASVIAPPMSDAMIIIRRERQKRRERGRDGQEPAGSVRAPAGETIPRQVGASPPPPGFRLAASSRRRGGTDGKIMGGYRADGADGLLRPTGLVMSNGFTSPPPPCYPRDVCKSWPVGRMDLVGSLGVRAGRKSVRTVQVLFL